MEHWDGNTWTVTPTPLTGLVGVVARNIAALASNDVYVIGDGGFAQGALIHWDGSTWSFVQTPNETTNTYYTGLSAVQNYAIWLTVIHEITPTQYDYRAEYFDGIKWQVFHLDASHFSVLRSQQLSAWAFGKDDLWLLGRPKSSPPNGPVLTEAAHWDGAHFTYSRLASPSLLPGQKLQALTMLSLDLVNYTDVWAAGAYGIETNRKGITKPLLEHWDGTTWTIVPLSGAIASHTFLYSVLAYSDADIWAGGLSNVDIGPTLSVLYKGSSTGLLRGTNFPQRGTPGFMYQLFRIPSTPDSFVANSYSGVPWNGINKTYIYPCG